MPWYYAYGHKADPELRHDSIGRSVWKCKICRATLTHVKQTNQPDQWRHPRKKRAK